MYIEYERIECSNTVKDFINFKTTLLTQKCSVDILM